jgi:hypothetical protein
MDPRDINQQIGNPFPSPSPKPAGEGIWAALVRMFGGAGTPAAPQPSPTPQGPQLDPNKVRAFQQGGGFNR